MDDEQLSVTTTRDGERAVIALAGELDVNTAPQVADELAQLTGGEPLTSVVIDVSRLTFLDSTGLRVILAGRESLQGAGATLALDGASGVVERVLEMTGLPRPARSAVLSQRSSAPGPPSAATPTCCWSRSMLARSRRETCTWLTPTRSAISDCDSPSK